MLYYTTLYYTILHYILYTIYSILYTIYYTIFSILYTPYSILDTLYTIHYTLLYTLHCTRLLYTLYYALLHLGSGCLSSSDCLRLMTEQPRRLRVLDFAAHGILLFWRVRCGFRVLGFLFRFHWFQIVRTWMNRKGKSGHYSAGQGSSRRNSGPAKTSRS